MAMNLPSRPQTGSLQTNRLQTNRFQTNRLQNGFAARYIEGKTALCAPMFRSLQSLAIFALKDCAIVLRLGLQLIICLQLVACHPIQTYEHISHRPISAETLAASIEQGTAPLILDVRSRAEYAAGHIPGAIHIHYHDIPQQIESIYRFKNDDIIVYCERGIRAGIAEKLLSEAGIFSVIRLTGICQHGEQLILQSSSQSK
ncbi:MAG: rhodanese-like domain-containing protein [Phormidesmis sp. RL_2_1]|nr:rhodanese-like domain-containing protein [Phormidesmis sp. RL_2_1]